MKSHTIRVTKEFGFETAHALWNYDGKCSNVHGHSYKLFITVIGKTIVDPNHTKLGMVIDFGDLKKIVNKSIVDRFDHVVILNEKAPHKQVSEIKQMFDRIEITPYQPTCENMVAEFADILKPLLPENVKLFSIKLYETANSFAEWFASDNS